MTNREVTRKGIEQFWEYNYQLLQKAHMNLTLRHEQLEKNYNELLKRTYADTDARRRD